MRVRLTAQGARSRVLNGKEGMLFTVVARTGTTVVHVRDDRYPTPGMARECQTWSLGDGDFEWLPKLDDGQVDPSYDLGQPNVLRDWSLKYGFRPYFLAELWCETDRRDVPSPSDFEIVEMISWPWFEDGKVSINVRTPNDPTTMRTVEFPQLCLRPTGVAVEYPEDEEG